MKEIWIKICCSILRLLGIAAVGASVSACYGVPIDPACMYGVPTVNLEFSGQVLNENDEPIKGIAVSYCHNSESINYTTSDEQGQFKLMRRSSLDDDSCFLYARDIDGKKNGSYQTDSLKVQNFTKITDGSGAWDQGDFEAKDITFHLKSKE